MGHLFFKLQQITSLHVELSSFSSTNAGKLLKGDNPFVSASLGLLVEQPRVTDGGLSRPEVLGQILSPVSLKLVCLERFVFP